MPNRGTSLGIVVILAVIALVAVFAFRTDAQPAKPLGDDGVETRAAGDAESTAVATSETESTARFAGPERRATEVAEPAAAASDTAAEPAVFRGRAVDPEGNPIAGVTASVGGWTANSARMDAYRAEHGEVEWEDPEPVTTTADGRFEVRFVPPPPYQFTLDLDKTGLVSVDGRWGSIAPGAVKDFGDVVMSTGTRVTGRFVDAVGNTVPLPQGERIQLSINRYNRKDRPRGEMTTEDAVRASLEPDGTFRFEKPAAPGMWNVSVRGFLLANREQEVEIAPPETTIEVEVVRPEDLLRVSGIVVDQTGEPVARADIDPVGMNRPDSWILSTGRDGTFEFVQRPNNTDPAATFGLQAEKRGHRTAMIQGITWGRRDVRIVLPRIPAMEVLVVRAADNTPVEDYGVRVMSTDGRQSSRDYDVIDGWKHADGITRVTTLQHGGKKRIFVEPRSSTGLAPVTQMVEVDAQSPPRLTIALPDAVEQPVRVLHADGEPATGSRVQLVDGRGEPVAENDFVLEFGGGSFSSSIAGIQLDSAETDAEGRCTIAGPPDVPLTLRVFGNHPTLVADGVTLTPDEQVFRLAAGATVTIRLDPPEVLADWRRGAGIAETGPVAAQDQSKVPTVMLHGSDPSERKRYPTGIGILGAPLDDDGTVVLEGVPAGRWRVRAQWRIDRGYESMTGRTELEVTPGEDHEYLLDVAAYRVGRVSGTLIVDGEPAANTQIYLQRELETLRPDGEPDTQQLHVETDTAGAFDAEIPGATWSAVATLELPDPRDPDAGWVRIRARPDVVVTPGIETTVELHATLARTALRIVNPGGEPVVGLKLWPTDADWLDRPTIGKTDAEGRTTLFGDPGSYRLSCRIRSLNDNEAYQLAMRQAVEAHGGDWKAGRESLDAIVELPTPIAVPSPTGAIVEIQLPEAWDR